MISSVPVVGHEEAHDLFLTAEFVGVIFGGVAVLEHFIEMHELATRLGFVIERIADPIVKVKQSDLAVVERSRFQILQPIDVLTDIFFGAPTNFFERQMSSIRH